MTINEQLRGEDQTSSDRTARLMRTLQTRHEGGLFRCSTCHKSGDMTLDENALRCEACGSAYPFLGGVVSALPMKKETAKETIQNFWHELYEAIYAEDNATLSRQELIDLLANLEAMFRQRQHLAVTEMPLSGLKNAEVLEIGSGNGAHSAMFAYLHDARMTAVDLTPSRVVATSRKLDLLLPEGDHLCLQADAESLPFADESFEVVYSNGVLHHTTDTTKAVREVYRVLKPGGYAVIMLYAKHSFQYWANIVIWQGILKGNYFRAGSSLGRSTEWMGKKPQTVFNPITRVYSEREIRTLFSMFANVKVRKNSFQWRVIPGLGGFLERTFSGSVPKFEGGRLVYGFPFRAETSLELWLGRHVGFGLNILAKK